MFYGLWQRLKQMTSSRARTRARTAIEAAALTERLIDAAIGYEDAQGLYVAGARKELFEARAAIEKALMRMPAN
jgi:hypothetical protein